MKVTITQLTEDEDIETCVEGTYDEVVKMLVFLERTRNRQEIQEAPLLNCIQQEKRAGGLLG
jgi:hypothetical protein